MFDTEECENRIINGTREGKENFYSRDRRGIREKGGKHFREKGKGGSLGEGIEKRLRESVQKGDVFLGQKGGTFWRKWGKVPPKKKKKLRGAACIFGEGGK